MIATGCYWHGDAFAFGRHDPLELVAHAGGREVAHAWVGVKGMISLGSQLISFRAGDTAHLRGVKLTCDGELATLAFVGGPTIMLGEDDAEAFGIELIQLAGRR